MALKTISDQRDEQRVALELLGDALHSAQTQLDRLWKLHEAKFGNDDTYIRDGSFTEAGIKRLYQFFEEKKRNVELAQFFGVTDGAIAYHRKRWMQAQALVPYPIP